MTQVKHCDPAAEALAEVRHSATSQQTQLTVLTRDGLMVTLGISSSLSVCDAGRGILGPDGRPLTIGLTPLA